MIGVNNMPTFTTKITGISAYPEKDGHTNVVFDVHWSHEGTDGTYTTAMSGSTSVPIPSQESFIPYSQLTEATVMSWIHQFTPNTVFPQYEQIMTDWLATQHQPTIINPPLPWIDTPSE